jgi:hypothetical protein
MTQRTEAEVLQFYQLTRLEERAAADADRVIRRLMELRRIQQ